MKSFIKTSCPERRYNLGHHVILMSVMVNVGDMVRKKET